eukprot:6988-Heterococcus_DN1.PRE.4
MKALCSRPKYTSGSLVCSVERMNSSISRLEPGMMPLSRKVKAFIAVKSTKIARPWSTLRLQASSNCSSVLRCSGTHSGASKGGMCASCRQLCTWQNYFDSLTSATPMRLKYDQLEKLIATVACCCKSSADPVANRARDALRHLS